MHFIGSLSLSLSTVFHFERWLIYWYVVAVDVNRSYMIRHKLPGPYGDTVGPTILSIMLMISITAQFAIKLISTNTVEE